MGSTVYQLPGIDLLDKTLIMTPEQYEIIRKKGEIISRMANDAGIECSYVNSFIFESAISYQMQLKYREDYDRMFSGKESIKNVLSAKNIYFFKKPGIHNDLFILASFAEKTVSLHSMLSEMSRDNNELTYSLGIDFLGIKRYGSLIKNGNLMIVGSAMSGKTSIVKAVLISLMMTFTPDDLKIITIDSKLLNYSDFYDSPYLLSPVVSQSSDITCTLRAIEAIVKSRVNLIASAGCKNIEAFNKVINNSATKKLSYIVVVMDQLDDIVSETADNYQLIQSIINGATIAGVHLICTCRETDHHIVKRLISNRSWGFVIIDKNAAEHSINSIGKMEYSDLSYTGDAVYKENAYCYPERIVLVQITDEEISKVNAFASAQRKPIYDEAFVHLDGLEETERMGAFGDPMLEEIKEFIIDQQKVSVSLLHRHFGIGYNRAARLIDVLEEEGVIGPAIGYAPREVYIKKR